MALKSHNLLSGRLKMRLWWSRWTHASKCRKAMWTHFLHPGHRKKRLERSRLSDVLSRRMALRIHNMPSENLKKRLWWSRWSGFKVPKAMRTHFLHSVHRYKRLGRSCLSDVLSRRMTLEIHNLPSERLKKGLWWSWWSDVSRCRKAMRTHFLHPVHR
jgi:hypothetical protein